MPLRQPVLASCVMLCLLACIAAVMPHAATAAPRIERLTSIGYGRTDSADLVYDVVRPVGGGRRPAVILLHGGGWWTGSRTDLIDTRPLAQMVARAGFVAIVPDYRLACGTPSTPRRAFGLDYSTGGPRCGGRFDDQVEDVLAVVRHVRAHAGTLQVDSSRVGLVGVSAGGHLAMLAAERGGRAARIQAVVNVSGPTATGFIRRQAARPQLPARTIRASFTNAVGCHPTACIRRWRAADPTIQLWRLPRSVRVLAIAGARETQVSLATMRDFQRRSARAGRSVEVVAGPGACHGAGCLYGRRPIAGPTPLAQTRSFLIDTLR